MDAKQIETYFLSLPETWSDFPFGPDVYVFKVKDKMFGTLGWEVTEDWPKGLARMNLKCDPEQAIVLRDVFAAVLPGYHMNKAHWNTVLLDGSIPGGELQRMIDLSYALVVKKLKRAERQSLEVAYGQDRLYRGLGSSA